MVTLDYILLGIAVLLAILDVVLSVLHYKPVHLEEVGIPQNNVSTESIPNDVIEKSESLNNNSKE